MILPLGPCSAQPTSNPYCHTYRIASSAALSKDPSTCYALNTPHYECYKCEDETGFICCWNSHDDVSLGNPQDWAVAFIYVHKMIWILNKFY